MPTFFCTDFGFHLDLTQEKATFCQWPEQEALFRSRRGVKGLCVTCRAPPSPALFAHRGCTEVKPSEAGGRSLPAACPDQFNRLPEPRLALTFLGKFVSLLMICSLCQAMCCLKWQNSTNGSSVSKEMPHLRNNFTVPIVGWSFFTPKTHWKCWLLRHINSGCEFTCSCRKREEKPISSEWQAKTLSCWLAFFPADFATQLCKAAWPFSEEVVSLALPCGWRFWSLRRSGVLTKPPHRTGFGMTTRPWGDSLLLFTILTLPYTK